MRKFRIITILLVLLLPLAGAAQDFCAPWIYCPSAVKGSEVYFQQSFSIRTKPTEARLIVATTGLVDVYLNGRNVSTALALPYQRAEGDTTAIAVSLDVRRFMQRGENIIAVHYSPASYRFSQRQLALSLGCRDAYGSRVALQSDENFACRLADSRVMANGYDSIAPGPQGAGWRDSIDFRPQWLGAAIYKERYRSDLTEQQLSWHDRNVTRVLRARSFEVQGDSVCYNFPEAFFGRVRVTLRDCKPGEEICVDGLKYRCTGRIDEQLYPRLAFGRHRQLTVSGDANFRREQLQLVEGLVP